MTLKLHGLELDFYTPELVNMRMKEKVYVRYDPEDLSSVRVYDMEDRFLCVAPQNKLTAGYLENQEQTPTLWPPSAAPKKAVREYGAASGCRMIQTAPLPLQRRWHSAIWMHWTPSPARS